MELGLDYNEYDWQLVSRCERESFIIYQMAKCAPLQKMQKKTRHTNEIDGAFRIYAIPYVCG